MEIYHLAMSHREKGWTQTNTARDFNVSIGLVSENLRLAHLIHSHSNIIHCKSRQEAIEKAKMRKLM